MEEKFNDDYTNKKKNQNKFLEILSIITSLLSSNCCIIQLILNIFSLGCAGFSIFEKFEIQFHSLTFIFVSLLIYKKGLKRNFLIIILCVLLSMSKRFLNLYLKENTINSNISLSVKGVKCNGCAMKLCSELKSIVKKCSIENLNPPIADLLLEANKEINENIIRNKINMNNFDYKILKINFIS